ncbi:MAG TPA: ATP synthase F1 subunit epsilon [Anaerolineae bacterium]|nr:ATP synthase F1 subunit epsilon [Anaerolineae bacterium]
MSPIRLEFVTQERLLYEDDVDMVIAPGVDGELGILPKHAPLMTILVPGEVIVRKAGEGDRYFAVGGGWLEVQPDKVTILARSGEAAEEIDIERAEAARRRAEAYLAEHPRRDEGRIAAEMALRRSRVRLKLARRRRRERPRPVVGTGSEEGS